MEKAACRKSEGAISSDQSSKFIGPAPLSLLYWTSSVVRETGDKMVESFFWPPAFFENKQLREQAASNTANCPASIERGAETEKRVGSSYDRVSHAQKERSDAEAERRYLRSKL